MSRIPETDPPSRPRFNSVVIDPLSRDNLLDHMTKGSGFGVSANRILLGAGVLLYACALYLWARLLGPIPPARVRIEAALVFAFGHSVIVATLWWWRRARWTGSQRVLAVPAVWLSLCVLLAAPARLKATADAPPGPAPLAELATTPALDTFAAELRAYGRIHGMWRTPEGETVRLNGHWTGSLDPPLTQSRIELSEALRRDSVDPAAYSRVVATMDRYRLIKLRVDGGAVLLERRGAGLLDPGGSARSLAPGDSFLPGRVIVRRIGGWYLYRLR